MQGFEFFDADFKRHIMAPYITYYVKYRNSFKYKSRASNMPGNSMKGV